MVQGFPQEQLKQSLRCHGWQTMHDFAKDEVHMLPQP
jgi:hypothetical protein